MKQKQWVRHAGLSLALISSLAFAAEEYKERGVGDVVYVPTPQIVVDEMLSMAKVGPKDFVIDLGSGDGRMVITAAKKFGARGFGVDLSDELLAESKKTAQSQGVADRAVFIKQNLFETDLSPASVITTYLLPSMNEKLRPKILSMKPGTRAWWRTITPWATGMPTGRKRWMCPKRKSELPARATFICGTYRQELPVAGNRRSRPDRGRKPGNSN